MRWLQLKLHCQGADSGALEDLLLQLGALSMTLTDAEDKPLFEPPPGETPLWANVVLTALFPEEFIDEAQCTLLIQSLERHWQPRALSEIQHSIIADKDWVRAWLDDFKPMRFGHHLWVCPSWWHRNSSKPSEWQPTVEQTAYWNDRNQDSLEAMQQPGNVVLLLDPGLAFGTGTHPTTALCLEWLEQQTLQGQTLIDYGCGSGILGIAALLLGAHTVYGIDNDPQALTATSDNCQKNLLDAARFPIYLPNDFAQAIRHRHIHVADGIMANILAGTLITLVESLSQQVKPGGWILLSGILREQADAVIASYLPWFDEFAVTAQEDWVRISAVRRN